MKNHWIELNESKNLRLWNVDDGEQWWYSAATREEVLEMHAVEMMEGDIDESEVEITEVDPDAIIPVRSEDDGKVSSKTAKEWSSEGKGLVASTLF
jgi:hypothetical protein